MTTQFEVGKRYSTRSICDYNCIITIEIVARTAKTITVARCKGKNNAVLRVKVRPWDNGVESVKPWGSYSMATVIAATDKEIIE